MDFSRFEFNLELGIFVYIFLSVEFVMLSAKKELLQKDLTNRISINSLGLGSSVSLMA